METQTVSTRLAIEECYKCGVAFGMPEELRRGHFENGGDFWCPNGHRQHFITTEVQRLRRKLGISQREAERERLRVVHAQEQQEAAERSLRSTKGHLTRTRKRIVNGACPYCHRSFKDLRRHMASKHPKQKKRYSNPKGKEA